MVGDVDVGVLASWVATLSPVTRDGTAHSASHPSRQPFTATLSFGRETNSGLMTAMVAPSASAAATAMKLMLWVHCVGWDDDEIVGK